MHGRIGAGEAIPRRLFFRNGGFLRPSLRRVITAAGHELRLFGRPGPEDGVIVWGHSPYAHRGEALARRSGAALIRAEDAFLRSVLPGRAKGAAAAPLGIFLDAEGVHFDPRQPSALERALARGPVTDPTLLGRAEEGIARIIAADLTKYSGFDPDAALPPGEFVLVVDQTAGDASVRLNGGAARFAQMLAAARAENPGMTLVIKSHPETARGLRRGHFLPRDLNESAGEVFLSRAVSPWRLLRRAARVYTVSSQLGYEAILAGHRPVVFGQPFYAGWGLSDDRDPLPEGRRGVAHIRETLFAVTHLSAPVWVCPCRGRRISFEEALDQMEAETRAWREDHRGYVALNMRLWKQRAMAQFFGGAGAGMRFTNNPARAAALADHEDRRVMVWGQNAATFSAPPLRVEDGILRSRGLGADLVAPLSLIADPLGAYYDPSAPSLIEAALSAPPPPGGAARAEALRTAILAAGLSKYNLRAAAPDLPARQAGGPARILVPGQVEDDASIRLGTADVSSNLGLLMAARQAHPEAELIYKPHPDVEAGLRPGAIAPEDLELLADHVAHRADPMALLEQCDAVWTMTSTLGFEALMRGVPVTCLGAPFYAGWGLTQDLGPVPERRRARPDLAALVHAVLIAAPRYRDPVSGRPCPPEIIVERLASGWQPRRGPGNRLLAKAQGLLAGQSWLWRR